MVSENVLERTAEKERERDCELKRVGGGRKNGVGGLEIWQCEGEFLPGTFVVCRRWPNTKI